jgi:hypothetical protein
MRFSESLLYGKGEIDGNYENIITPDESFASVIQTLNGTGLFTSPLMQG